MDIEEIPEGYRFPYEKECKLCCFKHEVLTQRDNYPEYETNIYIKCRCGEFIEFILPVN